VDLFQVAPKQKSVTMTSPILLKIITKFPLHRLHTFAYVGLIPAEAEIAIPLMSRLSSATKFRLGLDICDPDPEILELPPITSNLIGFTLET
jgi:hypothetical protein